MKIQTYEGEYAGEAFLAVTDPAGNLHVQSGAKRRTIPARKARPIIAELERASGAATLYGDSEIATVHHFILEGALVH